MARRARVRQTGALVAGLSPQAPGVAFMTSALPSPRSRIGLLRRMLLVAGLFPLPCALSMAAQAQVTTNTSALDSVTPAAKPAAKPATSAAHPTGKTPVHSHPSAEKSAPSSEAAPAKAPAETVPAATTSTSAQTQAPGHSAPSSSARPVLPATIPAAPPPPPILTPPPVPVELHPFPTPPDSPAVKDAQGEARPLEGGARITFKADSAQLNEATRNAILGFARDLAAHPDTRAILEATASGVPNDPSRPRRMALSRGLAVRAVLMNAGIPSTRIYVRVLGLPSGEDAANAPDHVDMRRSDTVP